MTFKLYHGSSPYLSLKAVKEEITKYPEVSFQTVNAEIQEAQKLFDLLGSPSLFTSQRGIVIKRLYKNKEKDKLIENILLLLKNNNSTDVIFFWEDEKIRSTTKYLKFFKDNSLLEEYDELNKRTFMTWLKTELQENGLQLSIEDQKLLAEKSNYDPERCSNEIKKLKLDPDSNLEYITNTLEKDIWSLIDAINQKDRSKSMEILENLTSQGNDPNYILSMLARNLRIMTLVKHLLEKGMDFKSICSILRIPPFTLPSIINTAKSYDQKSIIQIYKKLSNLDFQIKTGKIDGQLGLTLICPYL